MTPAHAAASRAIPMARASGPTDTANRTTAAPDRIPATSVGPRMSPSESASAPQAGAATRLTAANRAIRAPTVPRSSLVDARYTAMYGRYAPWAPNRIA